MFDRAPRCSATDRLNDTLGHLYHADTCFLCPYSCCRGRVLILGGVLPATTARAFLTASLPSADALYSTSCECGHRLLVNHSGEVNDVPLAEAMMEGNTRSARFGSCCAGD